MLITKQLGDREGSDQTSGSTYVIGPLKASLDLSFDQGLDPNYHTEDALCILLFDRFPV